MSKTQKALGKLRHKIAQAETDARTARRIHEQAKRVTSLNDTLNATVVEQNERMETLASNCTHYRQRVADLQDKVGELEERNGDLYSRLKDAGAAHNAAVECMYQEHRELLQLERKGHAKQLAEAQSYLRLSRISTIVVTVALLAVVVWPYAVKLVL